MSLIILTLALFLASAFWVGRGRLFDVAVFVLLLTIVVIVAQSVLGIRPSIFGTLVQLALAGALYTQKDRFAPLLEKAGVTPQWERLKASMADYRERQKDKQAKPKETQSTAQKDHSKEEQDEETFRIEMGKRHAELDPQDIVRGVWESVVIRQSAMSGAVIDRDAVEAVNIAVFNGMLTARSERKTTYAGALVNDLQPNANVNRVIDIQNINSIELQNQAQFFGDNGQPINTQRRPPSGFTDRHPYAVINGLKCYRQDNASLWIVFAFLADGERSPLLKSFNYDECVKWRTKIANLVQAERMKIAQTPVENDGDYL